MPPFAGPGSRPESGSPRQRARAPRCGCPRCPFGRAGTARPPAWRHAARAGRRRSSGKPALVLLSAQGRQAHRQRGAQNGLMVGDRVEEFAARARGHGKGGPRPELMLMPGWWYAISARASRPADRDADTLELAPTIKCLDALRRGEQGSRKIIRRDFRASQAARATWKSSRTATLLQPARGGGGEIVSSWLSRTLHLASVKPENRSCQGGMHETSALYMLAYGAPRVGACRDASPPTTIKIVHPFPPGNTWTS